MNAANLLKILIRTCLASLLLAFPFFASGQAVGDYRTNATGTWNWNTPANWQRCVTAGTWAGATSTTYPGQNPGAGVVNILDNTIVQVSADVPNSIGELRIDGGANESYVSFTGSYTLDVAGLTYLRSNTNNAYKAVHVDSGIFSTGSVEANSSGNTRDAYIRISTGSVVVTGDIELNANLHRTYIQFTDAGILYAGGAISGGNITSTTGGGPGDPTSGTVVYNGSSPQTIGNYTYYNLSVNNSLGVTLPGNITVDNDLSMIQGNISNGGNLLTVTGSLDYTSGTIIGSLRRTLTTTATEYLYPVGTDTSYNALKISFTNLTAGTLTVQFQALDIGTTGLPLTDDGIEIADRCTSGYWTMTAGTLSSTDYDVTLNYSNFPDVNEGSRIIKRTDGGSLVLDGTHGFLSSPEISRTGLSGISTVSTDLAIGKPSFLFISQPYDYVGCNAIFSVVVSGYEPFTYRWQENDGGGFADLSDGGIYSGTGTADLSIYYATPSMSGYEYRCVVTDGHSLSYTSNSATLTVLNQNIWTGAVDADWNTGSNWLCGSVPGIDTDLIIPDTGNDPVINSGIEGYVNNLTIESGSVLTIGGGELSVYGSVTCNGVIDATNGTILMKGSSAQNIDGNNFTGSIIKNLVADNVSGVTVQSNLFITEYILVSAGTVSSGGNLILTSSPSGTAFVDGSGTGEITGNVTMQRYLSSGFGYRYISSPFTGETVNGLSDDVNLGAPFPRVYKYDESRIYSGWVSYVNTDSLLRPLHGYSVNFGSAAVPLTFDMTGSTGNGTYTRTLYNHNNTYTQGYNLIGNPYPSAIDWDAASGWTKTNIDDAVYYFKPSATDQYGGTYSSYINGGSSDGIVNNIIPSMQGFFIHVTDGAYPVTATLSMNNSIRVTNTTQEFSKSASKGEGSHIRLSVHFTTDTAAKDYMLIYTDEKATDNFDSGLDALKLMNTDLKVPNLYAASPDARKLSVSGIPLFSGEELTIPLGLKINTAGNVVFRLKSAEGSFSGYSISLRDETEGVSQILDNQGEYKINLASSEYFNRFFLDINSLSTGKDDIKMEKRGFTAWVSNGVLMVDVTEFKGDNAILYLTDLTGRRLSVQKIWSPGQYELTLPIKNGIYIITMVSGGDRSVQKMIITGL